VVRAAALIVAAACALVACSGDGGGDLTQFCAEVEELSTNDPFSSFGDAAGPEEIEAGFDSLVERADDLAAAAPEEIAAAADGYRDAAKELRDLLRAAGFDGSKVDALDYQSVADEYGETSGDVEAFAGSECPTG
jgi:hypothetical protein